MPDIAYAARVGATASALGEAYMISPEARAFAKAHGLRGRQAYMIGRFGVLGPVHADVVVAAQGFWRPEVVTAVWDDARTSIEPQVAADGYAAMCREWGAARFSGFAGAARLAELAWQVADGAAVAAAPLFAGWRAMPRHPEQPAGDCVQAAHVLRELRMARHLVAVVATGLTPLEAVVSGPGGAGNAEFFGYEPPYPDRDVLAERRAAAEDLTDTVMAPVYDVLAGRQRVELEELLDAALAHLVAAGRPGG